MEQRRHQRGLSKSVLDIIQKYGRSENAPAGIQRLFIGKKEHQEIVTELKRTIQIMDKVKGCYIIINNSRVSIDYKRTSKKR